MNISAVRASDSTPVPPQFGVAVSVEIEDGGAFGTMRVRAVDKVVGSKTGYTALNQALNGAVRNSLGDRGGLGVFEAKDGTFHLRPLAFDGWWQDPDSAGAFAFEGNAHPFDRSYCGAVTANPDLRALVDGRTIIYPKDLPAA
jgi:hypothetical protein